MRKYFIKIVTTLLILFSFFVNAMADDRPYQKTKFVIENHAAYPVLLTIDTVEGEWESPIVLKQAIFLDKNQKYENILISLKKDVYLENFVSFDIAEKNNARENYLIFAETTNSKNDSVDSDIFDGLGALFVQTKTNDCKEHTSEGYTYCKLILV